MAFAVADRVRETSTTTGTGTLTLLGATAVACQTFSTGIGNGNTAPYTIVHQSANEWEISLAGTVGAGTLARTAGNVVAGSSGAGVLVNFSAGTKDVWCGQPATFSGPGAVLQMQTFASDAGSSTTSTTLGSLSGSSKSITPKSTNSILLVECTFAGFIAILAATNTTGSAQIMEGGVAVGTLYPFSVGTSAGGQQLSITGVVRARLTNSALTARSFTLAGKTSNAGTACSLTDQLFTITEVQGP